MRCFAIFSMIACRLTAPDPPTATIKPPFLARERGDTALDLARVANTECAQFQAGGFGCDLERRPLPDASGSGWIPQQAHAVHARHNLSQELQPFSGQAVFELHEPGGVAAGPCQACDKSRSDRVDRLNKNNWHRAARPLHGEHSCSSDNHHVGRQLYQFRGGLAKAIGLGCPIGGRSASSGLLSSPAAAIPVEMLPDGVARPDPRPRRSSARPLAARAPTRARKAAAPPRPAMKSRRFISTLTSGQGTARLKLARWMGLGVTPVNSSSRRWPMSA